MKCLRSPVWVGIMECALLLGLLICAFDANAQNVICADRPTGDSTYACANTRFIGTATAGFVTGPASAISGNLTSFNGTTGKLVQDSGITSTPTGSGLLVLQTSPGLLGVPTAPTAAPGTNTTQLATTAFVLANSSIACLATGGFAVGTGAGQQCSTSAGSTATLNGGPLTINDNPAGGTLSQGLVINNKLPATGSQSAAYQSNGVGVNNPGYAVTGTAPDSTYGLNPQLIGLRVQFTANMTGNIQTAFVASISQQSTGSGDLVGIIGSAYSNISNTGFGNLWGNIGYVNVGTSANGNHIYGLAGQVNNNDGSASFAYRTGVEATAMQGSTGTSGDSAFVVAQQTNGGLGAQAPFINGLMFSVNIHGSNAPLASTGTMIAADAAFTTANFADLHLVTFTGNLLSFPNMAVAANGTAVFGAGSAGLSSAPVVITATVSSGGNSQLAASTNTTTGFDGLQIHDSSGNVTSGLFSMEAANTGTFLGQTQGSWTKIVSLGSASLGILFGTATNEPLIVGTNNTAWLNLSAGGTFTFSGPLVETINQNAQTAITINNNSTGTGAFDTVVFTNATDNGGVGLGGTGYTGIAALQNKTYLYKSTGAGGGIVLYNAGANPIITYISGSEVGRWDSVTAGQLDLGVAGATVGQAQFRNATSGSITLTPATGALGTVTLTMPATTGTLALVANANVASVSNSDSTLTISPTTGAVVASLNLAQANTWTGAITETINQNAGTQIVINNSSAGTGAFASFGSGNGTNTASFGIGGTGYTGVTLLQARGFVFSNAAALAIVTGASNPIVFGINSSESGRWDATTVGQLDLGVAGTTVGQIQFSNATSGTITLKPTTGALGTVTLTMPAATGTLALVANANVASVSNSDGTLTISPTTGAVVASINLAQANTWTGAISETINQNAGTSITVSNNSTGTGALTNAVFNNSANFASVGIGGTGYTGAVILQNRAFINASSGSAGLVLYNGGTNPTIFTNNSAEVARFDVTAGQFDLGLAGTTVGVISFRNATSGSVNLQPTTGALGSAVITAPATTGTMTVLGNTTTGSGTTLVLSTTPTFTTSIITPLIDGGTAAGSTLTLNGTSNGSPSAAYAFIQTNGQFTTFGGTLTPQALITATLNSGTPAANPAAGTIGWLVGQDGAHDVLLTLDQYGGGGNNLPKLVFRQGNNTAASPTASTSGNALGAFNFLGYTGSAFYKTAQLFVKANETFSGTAGGADLVWYTTPNTTQAINQSVVFRASGGLAITTGSDDPGAGGLFVNGQTFAPNITTTSAAQTGTVCWTTGTGKFTVDTTLACLSSSERWKHDIRPIDEDIDVISELTRQQAVTYLWNAPIGEGQRGTQIGMIAERVWAVDPKLAGLGSDGQPHGWRQEAMLALLLRGWQKDHDLLSSLQADNDNLRAEMAQLRKAANQ